MRQDLTFFETKPSWRDMQLWIMEGWFMADAERECYGLVFEGYEPWEDMEEDYI